jgi:hypothetical protein
MFNHQQQQGYLTLAINGQVDYLRLAYAQALSIKSLMPDASYAVAVDTATEKQITDQQRRVFDYVVLVPDVPAPMFAEPELFWATPFKETIKLEADLVITRDISHWWTGLRNRELVLSTDCRNYKNEIVKDTIYRKLWRDNQLPNIYNGLMYFRFTRESLEFFTLAREIFNNWTALSAELINCRDAEPATDQVYALTAKIFGAERCTIPSLDYFTMTHMKPHIQGWPASTNWIESVVTELDGTTVRINNIEQQYPFHYHVKEWLTEEIINTYESTAGVL